MRQPASPQPTRVPVSRLSGKAAFAPAPVSHVVVTEFAKGAQWNPQPLSPGLAVLEMLRHCIPARRKPAHVLTILKAVMRTARACRSPRGEARATAELLLRSLEWEASLP